MNLETYINLQRAVVGTMIVFGGTGNSIEIAGDMLTEDDFTRADIKRTFSRLVNEGHADIMILASEKVAPGHEIALWVDIAENSAFMPQYCRQIKEYSKRLKIYDGASKIIAMAETTATSDQMVNELEALITSHTTKHKRDPVEAKDLIPENVRELKSRYENRGKFRGIITGLSELDKYINGLPFGGLGVIGARPSMGKTAIALNFATNAAGAGFKVVIFSLEMSRQDVMDRIISSKGGINFGNLRSGNLNDNEWPRYHKAASEISGCSLLIDDTPGITLREVISKARKLKRTAGLDLLIIDYLQLMATSPRDNRNQAIGEITRGLKQLALELNICVVVLSQLNRNLEARTNKRPTMADLRESGEIEQDADVILFPYREAVYCPECKERKPGHDYELCQSKAELFIAKNRNGEANRNLELVWLGEFQSFKELPKG